MKSQEQNEIVSVLQSEEYELLSRLASNHVQLAQAYGRIDTDDKVVLAKERARIRRMLEKQLEEYGLV